MDESRNTKADVVAHSLGGIGYPDASTVLMVGDREHDVIGAAQHGIKTLGVLYGYGSREELEGTGAAYIANSVMDILKYV